jgi:hypothetical protein
LSAFTLILSLSKDEPFHSDRSALIGLTVVARRAGTLLANIAADDRVRAHLAVVRQDRVVRDPAGGVNIDDISISIRKRS